jgi:hypothetical protein
MKNKFDFVAAYVIPEDVCFILPEKKVRGMWSVGLYPKLESSKYHEYNEAWHLLRGEAPGLVAWIARCRLSQRLKPRSYRGLHAALTRRSSTVCRRSRFCRRFFGRLSEVQVPLYCRHRSPGIRF